MIATFEIRHAPCLETWKWCMHQVLRYSCPKQVRQMRGSIHQFAQRVRLIKIGSLSSPCWASNPGFFNQHVLLEDARVRSIGPDLAMEGFLLEIDRYDAWNTLFSSINEPDLLNCKLCTLVVAIAWVSHDDELHNKISPIRTHKVTDACDGMWLSTFRYHHFFAALLLL